MALSPTAAAEPSGSPQTARRWFSNWLRLAPSIVQCAGVVDPRGHLVAEQRVARLEQLDRQHADVVQLVHQRERMRLGGALHLGFEAGCGRAGEPEDAVAWWFSTSG